LLRAQAAILNPHLNPADLRFGDLPTTNKVGFSPNVVALDIHGPDLPEVSFYDLPGAINIFRGGEEYLVAFVESLIKHYIRDENALVLLACSAETDIENSTAFRFVSECKARDRCMGVLTKPDLMRNKKALSDAKILLSGADFQLGKKWFVTKQVDLEEGCDVKHAEARSEETEYFANEPWTGPAFVPFAARFGTKSLQNAISQHLSAHILHELPEIGRRVHARLEQVQCVLQQFPARPKSASFTVMDEYQALTRVVVASLRSDGADNEFRNDYKKLVRAMQQKLKSLRPMLILSTPGYESPAILLDSGDDTPQPARFAMPETPSVKRRRGPNGQPMRTPNGRAASMSQTPQSSQVKREGVTDQQVDAPAQLVLRLDELHEIYEQGSNSMLPDQINPKVTEFLIARSIRPWPATIASTIDAVKQYVEGMLVKSIRQVLAKRASTQLLNEVSRLTRNLFSSHTAQLDGYVQNAVACETHRPVTYQALKTLSDPCRKSLYEDRMTQRINEYYEQMEAKTGKVLPTSDKSKKRGELAEGPLKSDQYEREVGAMATPLAYYDLASARIVDTIAMLIDHNLLNKLEKELGDTLRDGLRITDEEYCIKLLAEDPEREAYRTSLEVEKEKLNIALAELNALPHQVSF
jgi:hypothetical protein